MKLNVDVFEFSCKAIQENQKDFSYLKKAFEEYAIKLQNIMSDADGMISGSDDDTTIDFVKQLSGIVNRIFEISDDAHSFETAAGNIRDIYDEAEDTVRVLLTGIGIYRKQKESDGHNRPIIIIPPNISLDEKEADDNNHTNDGKNDRENRNYINEDRKDDPISKIWDWIISLIDRRGYTFGELQLNENRKYDQGYFSEWISSIFPQGIPWPIYAAAILHGMDYSYQSAAMKEIAKKYIDMINNWWENFTSKKAGAKNEENGKIAKSETIEKIEGIAKSEGSENDTDINKSPTYISAVGAGVASIGSGMSSIIKSEASSASPPDKTAEDFTSHIDDTASFTSANTGTNKSAKYVSAVGAGVVASIGSGMSSIIKPKASSELSSDETAEELLHKPTKTKGITDIAEVFNDAKSGTASVISAVTGAAVSGLLSDQPTDEASEGESEDENEIDENKANEFEIDANQTSEIYKSSASANSGRAGRNANENSSDSSGNNELKNDNAESLSNFSSGHINSSTAFRRDDEAMSIDNDNTKGKTIDNGTGGISTIKYVEDEREIEEVKNQMNQTNITTDTDNRFDDLKGDLKNDNNFNTSTAPANSMTPPSVSAEKISRAVPLVRNNPETNNNNKSDIPLPIGVSLAAASLLTAAEGGLFGAAAAGAANSKIGEGEDSYDPAKKKNLINAISKPAVFAGTLDGSYTILGVIVGLVFCGTAFIAGVKLKEKIKKPGFRTGDGVSAVITGGIVQEKL